MIFFQNTTKWKTSTLLTPQIWLAFFKCVALFPSFFIEQPYQGSAIIISTLKMVEMWQNIYLSHPSSQSLWVLSQLGYAMKKSGSRLNILSDPPIVKGIDLWDQSETVSQSIFLTHRPVFSKDAQRTRHL